MIIKSPKTKLAEMLSDDLDFTYHSDATIISTIDQFESELKRPYLYGKQMFFRGEKMQSISRPLIPTIYRHRDMFFKDGKQAIVVDSASLYNYYSHHTNYFSLYEDIIGTVVEGNLYPFLAFSQHYFGVSPLLDFTKSLDVAMSFALKDRTSFDDDILLYTLELKNDFDYTNDLKIANQWLSEYSVLLFNNTETRFNIEKLDALSDYAQMGSFLKGKSFLDLTSPSAKLIDVPMNDLMRYQQGVFLLLDDFSLIGNSYLTKKVREDFVIKKWIISKEICPALLHQLLDEKPYYAYSNITDLSRVVAQLKKED